jgi:hypothetical protein
MLKMIIVFILLQSPEQNIRKSSFDFGIRYVLCTILLNFQLLITSVVIIIFVLSSFFGIYLIHVIKYISNIPACIS